MLPVPRTSLTAFAAFHVEASPAPPVRFVRKLPATGLPDDRVQAVLRDLIQSPERLLRFLRALLGGLDGLLEEFDGAGVGMGGRWGDGAGGEDTLLEDLVRAAARAPDRLAPIARLLDELQQTEEGRAVIPDGLLETWNAVAGALKGRGK